MTKRKSENSNEKKIQELLSSNKPILLEVRAECGVNSNLIEAIIQKIENEYNNDIRIARIDYKTHRALLPNLKLENFPTVLLMKGSKLIKRTNGTISRTNLKNLVNELIERN